MAQPRKERLNDAEVSDGYSDMRGKRKPKLNDGQRAFIVERLACYERPKAIQTEVLDEFGVEVTPQTIQHYDPTKRQAAHGKLAKKWRDLFEKKRAEFTKHIEMNIPGANKAVRMARLERYVTTLEERGNLVGAADMTERQAKEMGNAHTNRREITGKHRGPIEMRAVEEMSQEECRAELRTYGIDPDVHRAPITKQ